MNTPKKKCRLCHEDMTLSLVEPHTYMTYWMTYKCKNENCAVETDTIFHEEEAS